ncbi:MAG: PEP-CTERM sorting domain-containing protein [Verrucomicrobiota bacterium]|nr:PEP-CTERM sorting domain-containing protein [Verrucomicrobiota bacterium]
MNSCILKFGMAGAVSIMVTSDAAPRWAYNEELIYPPSQVGEFAHREPGGGTYLPGIGYRAEESIWVTGFRSVFEVSSEDLSTHSFGLTINTRDAFLESGTGFQIEMSLGDSGFEVERYHLQSEFDNKHVITWTLATPFRLEGGESYLFSPYMNGVIDRGVMASNARILYSDSPFKGGDQDVYLRNGIAADTFQPFAADIRLDVSPPTGIPEPSTWVLMGAGLALLGYRWKFPR